MNFSDLSSPAFFENPYPMYDAIRARGTFIPLAPNVVLTGDHGTIEFLLADRRMGKTYMQSVVARYGESGRDQPVFQALSRMFLLMNPPVHTRLRALLMKAFNARQIESLREIAQQTADRLIAAFPAQGEIDLMAQYALLFPLEIICRLLDIPFQDGMRLGSAASQVVRAFDAAPLDETGLREANEATLALESYFAEVVDARRRGLAAVPAEAAHDHAARHANTDLISALLTVEDEGAKLSEAEIVSNVVMLFVAGHETTSNMLGNALIALFRHPDQLQGLRNDPGLLPKAVTECMRFDTSVQMVVRTAFEDIALADAVLSQGTMVFMLLGAANRDPRRFVAPDEFNIQRIDQGRLLSFAGGIHYCLGARLAALEMEIGLGTLLARFPDLTITNLTDLRWRRRTNLRGVESLLAHAGR